MMLYVNGDSHTAGAEAVNPHAFAEDDPALFYLGRAPHPDNLAVTWGKTLSLALRSGFRCDAESASSNARIIRTTRQWLAGGGAGHPDQLIIIQWSTWEREEWWHNEEWVQVNASGADHVPQSLQEKYRHYIIGVDWQLKTDQSHAEIWEFHNELNSQNIRHIFVNGNNCFDKITDQKNWGFNYIEPYNANLTYNSIIRNAGIETVAPNSWHFGRDGHSVFAQFILNYIVSNKFV